MIVVVIATILITIAVPSYFSQIRKARRTEARTALLDLAGRQERFFSTNGVAYSQTATDFGYTVFPQVVGTGYYTVTACSPAANCDPNAGPPPAPSYYLIATPVAGQSQAQDAQCQTFGVDSAGRQFATDSGGADNTVYCWQR